MQCKDIDDREFLAVVHEIGKREHPGETDLLWVCYWDITALRPAWITKLVLAKARQLIKRGLMDGCTCGCRGDFELTKSGLEMLNAAPR